MPHLLLPAYSPMFASSGTLPVHSPHQALENGTFQQATTRVAPQTAASGGPSHHRSPRFPWPLNPVPTANPNRAVYSVQPPPPRAIKRVLQKKTLVIFDWDDTLFPTSAVVFKQQSRITIGDLYVLGKSMYELLGTYISMFGAKNLFIVTNGSKHWILDSLKEMSRIYKESFEAVEGDEEELRGKDFFAAIYNSFLSLRIPLLSARSVYSERYPDRPSIWKALMFKSIVRNHFNLRRATRTREGFLYLMISIGDSNDEFEAALEAKRMLVAKDRVNGNNNVVRLHRVKLMEKPAILQMVGQNLNLVKKAALLSTVEGEISSKIMGRRS